MKWTYDSDLNTYKRTRGGETEIDGNTGKQVETNIVVLMHTASRVLNSDYITVDTVGEGSAEFYQNGIMISGTWKNIATETRPRAGPSPENDLKFYDADSKEMKFVPGKMWIEILTK